MKLLVGWNVTSLKVKGCSLIRIVFLPLQEKEARSVKTKIITGDVIGLDKVVVATNNEFNELIQELKDLKFSEPPTVKVIESNQIITLEKVNALII